MNNQVYHIPAMLEECMDALCIKPSGTYVDATFGGGGHSRAILERLGPDGRLFSFDQDRDAFANRIDDPRFTFVLGNFRYLGNFLRYYGAGKADGILADLGVSFHHFDAAERGFSFRSDAPLDMRMNRNARLTAAEFINTASDGELTAVLRNFGDMKRPAPFVKAIIARRSQKPIETTGELLELISPLVNPRQEKKELAQIFQALRIHINRETEALQKFLEETVRVLRPGGRLAVLTYHSLEDRMVKNFIKTGNLEGRLEKDFFGRPLTPWKDISRGAISPRPEEVEANPRARSAKLRVAQLLPEKD